MAAIKIKPVDRIRYTKAGMAIMKDMVNHPEKQDMLINTLKDGGFEDIANLANDAKKYMPEVAKYVS